MEDKPKDEKYTPMKYINSARIVLGKIDLDPASSRIANSRIKADTIFTKQESGLCQKWFGKVWCNPPYSRGNLQKWTEKICNEYARFHFTEGIYLTPNSTDTTWFKLLWGKPICFTDHRISFVTWDDRRFVFETNPENGSCFTYFGENPIKFVTEFKKYGRIC